jgi:DNA-binding transcriptional MerR regulator
VAEWTIDELARQAGTTSRNIRAYQERGLVPPPRLAGRVGYYNEGHLARLRHIAQLLDRGFSLASIRELFEAWERGYGLADVLGFEEALAAPWDHEPSGLLSEEELTETFGGDPRQLAQAVRLGLLETEDDRYRVPSPRLLDAGRELVASGIPLSAILEEAQRLMTDLDGVAERWVDMFRDYLWSGYVARGMPVEELQSMTDFLRRIRPLLGSIVGPLLAQAMERQVAAITAETLGATPPPKARSTSEAS